MKKARCADIGSGLSVCDRLDAQLPRYRHRRLQQQEAQEASEIKPALAAAAQCETPENAR
jgi:hypothetical protein